MPIIPRALAALLVIWLFWAIAAIVHWIMRRILTDPTAENTC